MTIRRIAQAHRPDEFPAAKLYLDDLREIVNILTAQNGADNEDPKQWHVTYRVGDRLCDSLDELAQIGGKTRDLEIHYQYGKSKGYTGSLQLRRAFTLFFPAGDKTGDTYLAECGKIRSIFEGNPIWWKSVARGLLGTRHDWIVFIFPSLVAAAGGALFRSSWIVKWGTLVTLVWGASLLGVSVVMNSSIVCLRYSHSGGWGGWLRENGSKIVVAVLSAGGALILKAVFDRIWPRLWH